MSATQSAPRRIDALTIPADGSRLAPGSTRVGFVAYCVVANGRDKVTKQPARNPWESKNPNAVRQLLTGAPVPGWELGHVVNLIHGKQKHDMGDWLIVGIVQTVEVEVKDDDGKVTGTAEQVKLEGKPVQDKGKNPAIWLTVVPEPEPAPAPEPTPEPAAEGSK